MNKPELKRIEKLNGSLFMKIDNIIIIKAGKGYFHHGIESEGYNIITPYKGYGLFCRILRELCFRTPFLPKKVWYNRYISEKPYKYILIWDVLITVHYLKWIACVQPQAQLNYIYGNMIGKARHLLPYQVPSYYRIWSYDKGDCERYRLLLYKNDPYFKCYIKKKKKPRYDVLFVGSDKGRAGYLLALDEKLRGLGLKTNFIIVKDGRFSKNKPYYHSPVSYDKITDMVAESRAVLNVVMPGQYGVTLRDVEALLMGVKLITTNSHIKDVDFYYKENIYILDGMNVEGLIEFLSLPLQPVPQIIKNRFDLYNHIMEIITYEK